MQAKDISTKPILEYLSAQTGSASIWKFNNHPSVVDAIPEGTPPKVLKAKMASIIKKGLVGGCACGCHGDFEITDKGKEFLNDRL